MKTTLRNWILLGVFAASIPPTSAWAGGRLTTLGMAGTAIVGQDPASPRSAADSQDTQSPANPFAAAPSASAPQPAARLQADSLIVEARKALAVGDVRQATNLMEQARGLSVEYGPVDDTPDKVEAAIKKYSDLMELLQQSGNSGAMAHRRRYAVLLLEQAEALRKWRAYAEAERLAYDVSRMGITFGPYETSPEKLLSQLQKDKQTQQGTVVRRMPAGQMSPQEAKARTADLVVRARAAMRVNDMDQAEALAREAQSLGVPASAFGPQEDQPSFVLADVAQRRGTGASLIASDDQGGRYPVSPAGYDPGADSSRTVQVANQEPTPPEADTVGTPPAADPKQAFADGEQALRAREIPKALQLFRQAYTGRDQLDVEQQQRLRTYLMDLDRPAAQSGGLIQETAEGQDQRRQQLAAEVAARTNSAKRMIEQDPRGALEKLKETRGLIDQAEVDAQVKEMFLRRVDREIADATAYVEANKSMIDLADRNSAVEAELERERQVKLEVQNKLAKLVDEFNTLMNQQRYEEAELVAKRAVELAPNEQVVTQLTEQVRFVRRNHLNMDIRDQKERNFADAMMEVDRAAIPFNRDIEYPSNWSDLSRRRESAATDLEWRMSEKELEIEQRLKTPVSLSFPGAPLGQVLDHLGKLGQLNIHIDPQGLADEGVTTDTVVTIDLSEEISLQSALNLVLGQLNLGYVIEDEVLKITSERLRHGRMTRNVYYVADLVTPIPNFTLPGGGSMGMALKDAYSTAQGAANLGMHMAPMGVIASNTGSTNAMIDPSLLAQIQGGNPGSTPPAGSPMGNGPGGAGGGVIADFDSLIELITSTVDPESWTDMGGEGAVTPFPTNLSLVVRQTQENHREIANLLAQLRRLQDLQVTIEVRFITLNDNFFERIGIDFDFDIDDDIDQPFQVFGRPNPAFRPFGGGGAGGAGGDPTIPPTRDLQDRDHGKRVTVGQSNPGVFSSDLDIPFRQNSFNLAVPQFGGFDAAAGAQLGFAILSDLEAFFFVNAAQGDRRSNVLQAPKVTLFNGQIAFVADLSTSPFVISVIPVVGDFAAAQQPVIVLLSEGTYLNVQAVVSPDRRYVRMTLVPYFSQISEVNTFTFTGSETTTEDTSEAGPDDNTTGRNNVRTRQTTGTTVQLPTLATFSVTTTVSVPDGGTVLMGGIKRLSEGRNEFGVPMLNKLPYINRLFKNVGIGRETQSLMMMVTPRIIIQEEEEANILGGSSATTTP